MDSRAGDDERIVLRDRSAARKWLVRVMAARAVELYRERHGNQNNESDERHGRNQSAQREGERQARAG